MSVERLLISVVIVMCQLQKWKFLSKKYRHESILPSSPRSSLHHAKHFIRVRVKLNPRLAWRFGWCRPDVMKQASSMKGIHIKLSYHPVTVCTINSSKTRYPSRFLATLGPRSSPKKKGRKKLNRPPATQS